MPIHQTSEERLVNTVTAGNQSQPTLGRLADGGYVVTWTGPRGIGDFPAVDAVFAQRYDADGVRVGSQFRIHQAGNEYQFDSEVAGLPDGGFVVAWVSQDSSAAGIMARRFDSFSSPVGDAFVVNTDQQNSEENPSIATLSDGGFVITWSTFGKPGNIYGQRFGADGQAVGGEFRINIADTFGSGATVTGLKSGGFVVTWHMGDGDDTGIFARRFGSDGAPAGDQYRVNLDIAGTQRPASVVALEDGGFAVAWTGQVSGSASDLFVQRFSAAGERVGGEIVVTDGSSLHPVQPDITALADGGFVATWRESGRIVLRRYDADGEPVGDQWPAAAGEGSEFHSRPAVLGLADGSFVLSWGSQDGDQGGIFQAHFRDNGDGFLSEGLDRAMGTSASDYLTGFGGNDELRGADGDDVLEGGEGADRLYGGDGFDTASFAAAADAVSINLLTGSHGGEAAGDRFDSIEQFALGRLGDRFFGSAAAETVLGLGGGDLLFGGGGADQLEGGDGDDVLEGGLGADSLIGGDGFDEASYARAGAAVAIDLVGLVHGGEAAGDSFHSIERFALGRFDDSFAGSNAADQALGGAGADNLEGREGADYLDGGVGNDRLAGDSGNDVMFGNVGDDQLFGGGGDDYVNGGAGADYIEGGDGSDALEAGAGNDVLFGNLGRDNLIGGDGGDYLNGGEDVDYLDGGLGNDSLEPGAGSDVAFGGDGNDNLIGADGDDYLNGGGGIDYFEGGAGNDGIFGGLDNDIILGGGGDDGLHGEDGDDYLNGGDGTDYMTGGAGNDSLDGGAGTNILTGGAGADAFMFMAAPGTGFAHVVDFEAGADRIAFDDAAFGLPAGGLSPNVFRSGTGAHDADDRIIYNPETGALLFDADGAGGIAAVQFASLQAGLILAASDFSVI